VAGYSTTGDNAGDASSSGVAPSALSQAGTAYSAISGLTSGTTTGQIGGALSAGKLVNTNLNGANTQVGGALGAAGGVLGVYNGLQQGGVAGYGGAAVGALHAGAGVATMAGDTGLAGTLGNAAGALAIPLSVYNFANNWQSGNTSSDAIQGAETGAAIGSVIPGVGTLIGAGVGAAAGALSSALGPGETDPEQATWGNYLAAYQAGGNAAESALPGFTAQGVADTQAAESAKVFGSDSSVAGELGGSNPTAKATTGPTTAQAQAAYTTGADKAVAGASGANDYQSLAGLFDMRSSNLPIYQQFGRQGEGAFTQAMTSQIDNAIKAGTISANATPEQIYSQVVNPWIGNMSNSSAPSGKGWASTTAAYGADQPAVQQLLVNMIGNYQQGQAFTGVGGQAVQEQAYA
jgi:hypothetical protein